MRNLCRKKSADIDMLKCNKEATLEKALRCIDGNSKKVVFFVDENDAMVGLLTEGDIRRLLLGGCGFSDKAIIYAKKDFVYATVNDSYEEISRLFDSIVTIIPILDEKKRILDYAEYNKDMHISVAQPLLNGNEYKYLMDAFLSTWISSAGKYISLFETEFANYCGVKYGVATSNGTTAIHLALVALGIGEGDEVIVPDLTFAATINAVIYTGATPVIVDIEEDSWCINPREIESAITDRTKAIIPVHLYGQPCNMGEICRTAREHNIYIVEDCAEAHGAEWEGKRVGSLGHVGCFSFFGNKVITTGEGGMCITDDERLADRMRILRDHGMSKEKKYYHEVVGFNYRMTNMQAAIGCAQLERIDQILEDRKRVEMLYRDKLKGTCLTFQKNDLPNRKKITWLVSALIAENSRDLLFEKMDQNGIDTRSFFYPLSEMKIYEKYARNCFVSHNISKQGINFPTSYEVDDMVVDKILSIIEGIEEK